MSIERARTDLTHARIAYGRAPSDREAWARALVAAERLRQATKRDVDRLTKRTPTSDQDVSDLNGPGEGF